MQLLILKGQYLSCCIKLSGFMKCKHCNGNCQKAGKQKNGVQKLYCRACKKYQQLQYKYVAYNATTNTMIASLVCESVGIRGIARVLKIAINTVPSRIRKIASSIQKPLIPLRQAALQVDELRTYIKYKGNEYWIAYAYNKTTRKVIDFVVGKRSKRTLRILTNTLIIAETQKIYTDNLNIYQSLIPKNIHIAGHYGTNHIERMNLNLRTHLKRLSRKTICFNKSLEMLESCLKIYFWLSKST